MQIYCLKDNFNNIRYIGLTTIGLKKRLSQHIKDSKNKNKTHKDHWINSLLNSGEKPLIEEIDIAKDINELYELEKYWIKKMRENGCNLTNATDGGEGRIGTTPWNKGIPCPLYLKDAIKKANTGRNAINRKECFAFNIKTKEKINFNSLTELSVYIKSNSSNVVRSKNTGRPCKGWLINTDIITQKKERSDATPIIAINKIDGSIIEFSSLAKASVYTGAAKSNIYAVCINKKKSAKGYMFVYKETLGS